MENKQRWKRASIIRGLSNNSLQSKKSIRQERFELRVLRERVSKIDSDYQALADDPAVSIGVPQNTIDLKVILMALREEIMEHGIRVSNHDFPKGTNVVIPSIIGPFDIWYESNSIYLRRYYYKKRYRFLCEFENGLISERVIDTICMFLTKSKINEFRL